MDEKKNELEKSTAPEVIEKVPEEFRHIVRQSLSEFRMSIGPPESPIAKHITGEHITKQQENEAKAMDYENKDRARKHWLTVLIALALVALAVVVLFLFRDDTQTIREILVPVITGLAGAIGGYGYGKLKRVE